MDAQAIWGCTPLYFLHACIHFLSWYASHIHKPLLGEDKVLPASSIYHLANFNNKNSNLEFFSLNRYRLILRDHLDTRC